MSREHGPGTPDTLLRRSDVIANGKTGDWTRKARQDSVRRNLITLRVQRKTGGERNQTTIELTHNRGRAAEATRTWQTTTFCGWNLIG